MSDEIFVKLFIGAIAVILSWIGFEIRQTRKSLETKVDKPECEKDMCRHYSEIQNLWSTSRQHSERIAKLEK